MTTKLVRRTICISCSCVTKYVHRVDLSERDEFRIGRTQATLCIIMHRRTIQVPWGESWGVFQLMPKGSGKVESCWVPSSWTSNRPVTEIMIPKIGHSHINEFVSFYVCRFLYWIIYWKCCGVNGHVETLGATEDNCEISKWQFDSPHPKFVFLFQDNCHYFLSHTFSRLRDVCSLTVSDSWLHWTKHCREDKVKTTSVHISRKGPEIILVNLEGYTLKFQELIL